MKTFKKVRASLQKKKAGRNLLSIIVLMIFVSGAVSCSILYDGLSTGYNSYNNSSSGNSSSSSSSSSNTSDCDLKYWVEKSSGYYIPYFQKTGDCWLSLDYALYYTSGEFFMDGHLYFTKNSSSPSSGHYAKSPIKIVIKSKKWEK